MISFQYVKTNEILPVTDYFYHTGFYTKKVTQMIHGIGLDIVEIERIATLLDRQPKIARRVLTPSELNQFNELGAKRRVEFLSGRFAVKEAYAKAIGCGIGRELSFQDIEIVKEPSGRPFISHPDYKVHVSITHTKEYAAAQVVVEKTDA